ncbi:redox-sensitive transcriptional activator SoxR [Vibrio harveyi]|nr:redox-sensitive transcriptional activator SoxR [Vibrio harveyi]
MEISVGEVAKRSGVKVSALHFYEQKGLISSWRNQGNQRRYHRSVLRRIAVIKAAQQVGLIPRRNQTGIRRVAQASSAKQATVGNHGKSLACTIDLKIQKLKALQNDLGGCIGCGCLSLETCALRNPEDILGKEHSGSNLTLDD